MKLLIAEDNKQMRHLIREVVAEQFDDFEECSDGDEAVSLYGNCLPDWVIMDYEMPRLDGISATKEILNRYPKANIIVISQYDDQDVRLTSEESGAKFYLPKERIGELTSILSGN